jgi:hypothetical protein
MCLLFDKESWWQRTKKTKNTTRRKGQRGGGGVKRRGRGVPATFPPSRLATLLRVGCFFFISVVVCACEFVCGEGGGG